MSMQINEKKRKRTEDNPEDEPAKKHHKLNDGQVNPVQIAAQKKKRRPKHKAGKAKKNKPEAVKPAIPQFEMKTFSQWSIKVQAQNSALPENIVFVIFGFIQKDEPMMEIVMAEHIVILAGFGYTYLALESSDFLQPKYKQISMNLTMKPNMFYRSIFKVTILNENWSLSLGFAKAKAAKKETMLAFNSVQKKNGFFISNKKNKSQIKFNDQKKDFVVPNNEFHIGFICNYDQITILTASGEIFSTFIDFQTYKFPIVVIENLKIQQL